MSQTALAKAPPATSEPARDRELLDYCDALYGNLPLALLLAGAEGQIVYANRQFFRLTEITPDELTSLHLFDVLSVFCLTICDDFDELLNGPAQWRDIDKPLARADGSLAWDRVLVDSLTLPGGQVCHRLLVDNVTPYKVAIEGLLKRKNLYQSIVETRPDIICCFLPDWSLTYVNAQGSRVLAGDGGDLMGESLLKLLPEAAREGFAEAVSGVSIDSPIAELEVRTGQDDTKGPRHTRWIIQGFFYRSGFIRDYQATGIDVTGLKISESRVIHADRLVSLGTLVSEVAHEISNPNNYISLNAPLALELWERVAPMLEKAAGREKNPSGVPLAEVLRDMPQLLRAVMDGAARIKHYVRELKNYARADLESGFETLSVNEVVQSAVLLMNKTIGRHTSRFEVSYGAGLPLVRGRRHRLEQVVVNLVQNACHALSGPEQGIAIETVGDPGSGMVRIEVSDQGMGIPEQDLSRVTDPFYSTKRGQGGTGLGLSISLSIAREHGGALSITSRPGRGTKAAISLPAAGAKAATP